jgi:hypothetical protein
MLKGFYAPEGIDLRDHTSTDYCRPPELVSATLDDLNITIRFNEIYGNERGWCSKLWRGYDLFGSFEGNKQLDVHWVSEDGRIFYKLVGPIGSYDIINLPSEIPEGSYWGSYNGRFVGGMSH